MIVLWISLAVFALGVAYAIRRGPGTPSKAPPPPVARPDPVARARGIVEAAAADRGPGATGDRGPIA